jgi:hypothetical protein
VRHEDVEEAVATDRLRERLRLLREVDDTPFARIHRQGF